ncbi:MAG TPA: hypothetical protein VGE07_29415 [Herpetosiphonaceae bacterium]
MNIDDKMAYLHRLRQNGDITAAEFARAEAGLRAHVAASAPRPTGNVFDDELGRVDHEWMMERERLLVRNSHGRRVPPVFSPFGTLIAIAISAGLIYWSVSMGEAWQWVLFGVAFLAITTIGSLARLNSANAYQEAEGRYQRRRAEILARHGQASHPPIQSNFPLYR